MRAKTWLAWVGSWAALVSGAGCITKNRVARRALDQAIAQATAQGFSGQILVGNRQQLLFDTTVGMAATPPIWTWGSISKQVTAALTMSEVERGALSLDDSIGQQLPEFPNPATRRVTVRQLLQHTSGLPNPDDPQAGAAAGGFFSRQSAAAGGRSDALGFCAGPPQQPPGAFVYNNCDTIVLGAILQRTSGQDFAALLAKRVTEPLGLRTVRMVRLGEHPVRARGAAPQTELSIAAYGPGGAVVGSGRDLLRFDQALLTHRLLRAETTDEMWRGEARLGYVALGAWSFAAPLAGCAGKVALVERRGAVDGIQSRNILAPELGLALVVLTDNSDLEFGEIWQGQGISYRLASAAFCGTAVP